MACLRGGSYAACFNSFSYITGNPCAADGNVVCTGIMSFMGGDEIDQDKLDELINAIVKRLESVEDLTSTDPRRASFDTPFHNETGDTVYDITLIYQGSSYKRSEVNYLGQGVWGAVVGESLEDSLRIAQIWKSLTFGEYTPGVKFWTTYGYQKASS
jgi:hypothetical protein